MTAGPIIAVDPGTSKCGIAVVDHRGRCLLRDVAQVSGVFRALHGLADRYPGALLVMGDRTGAESFQARLREEGLVARLGEPIAVDEHRSSEEGRRRYLIEHRRGWRRWVPMGLLTPDSPVDGYVAEVLAHRYLMVASERER